MSVLRPTYSEAKPLFLEHLTRSVTDRTGAIRLSLLRMTNMEVFTTMSRRRLPPLGGAKNPDGLAPGQCADRSNPPLSKTPGLGAECILNPFRGSDSSLIEAELLCSTLANPTKPYPPWCVNFDQLGIRVPLPAISPSSKPHYVGHTIGDHTSILAFIEKRFLTDTGQASLHLTARDQNANPFKTLFDFDNSPSRNTPITQAQRRR